MPRHVLFDLDGTLTDSAPGITRSLAHSVRAVGGAPPAAVALRPFIGNPLREIFATLLEDADTARIDAAVQAYGEQFDRAGFYENALFPGVLDSLTALCEGGCTLYVATAKGQDVAERVIDHFGLRPYFRAVFGTQRDRGISSKQDVLGHGLRTHAIPRSQATMVGDRSHDVDAARALGIQAIGVSWGYGALAELSSAHAIAETPSALVRLIGSAPSRRARSSGP